MARFAPVLLCTPTVTCSCACFHLVTGKGHWQQRKLLTWKHRATQIQTHTLWSRLCCRDMFTQIYSNHVNNRRVMCFFPKEWSKRRRPAHRTLSELTHDNLATTCTVKKLATNFNAREPTHTFLRQYCWTARYTLTEHPQHDSSADDETSEEMP